MKYEISDYDCSMDHHDSRYMYRDAIDMADAVVNNEELVQWILENIGKPGGNSKQLGGSWYMFLDEDGNEIPTFYLGFTTEGCLGVRDSSYLVARFTMVKE
jgi:hypothetical protein